MFTDGSIVEGGGVIWDGALVLSKFLAKNPLGFTEFLKLDKTQFQGTVIELGAGTGFGGLTLAQLLPKSRVYLTEISEGSLRIMNKSIKTNDFTGRVSACRLEWGERQGAKLRELIGEVKLIIGADIIYIEKHFP